VRHRLRPAPVLIAAALAGCGTASSRSGDIDADDLPELALVEELRIGSLEDPELGFSSIGGVAVDAGGRTYVLERQEREIRVYDRDGTRVGTIGGPGSGPGEFESPTSFGLLADTVWVSDSRLGRMTLFTSAGEVVSTIMPSAGATFESPGGVRVTVRPSRIRADGLLEGSGGRITVPNGGPPQGDLLLPRFVFDRSGAVIDTIAIDTIRNPFSTSVERIEVGAIRISKTPPPSDEPYPVTTADGGIRIERPHAPTGDESVFTVTRTGLAGDTVYHRAFRYAPRPYDDALIDSMAARRAQPYEERAGADFDALKAAIREAYVLPPFQAPVTLVRLGADESLWIRREEATGAHRWIVLRPDGSPRGQLEFPRRDVIAWSSGDQLWMIERDEYDVQWLVRYRIRGG